MRQAKEHMPIDLSGEVFLTGGFEIGVRLQSLGTSEIPALSARQLINLVVRVLSHRNTEKNLPSQYVPLYLKAHRVCTGILEEAKVSLKELWSPEAPIEHRRLVESGFSFGRINFQGGNEGWRIIVEDDAPMSWDELVNLAAFIARDEWMERNFAKAYVPHIPVYQAEMWTKSGELISGAKLDLPYRDCDHSECLCSALETLRAQQIEEKRILDQFAAELVEREQAVNAREEKLSALESQLNARSYILSQKETELHERESKLVQASCSEKPQGEVWISPKRKKRYKSMEIRAGRSDLKPGDAKRFFRQQRKKGR